jgi:hypothetical protein
LDLKHGLSKNLDQGFSANFFLERKKLIDIGFLTVGFSKELGQCFTGRFGF